MALYERLKACDGRLPRYDATAVDGDFLVWRVVIHRRGGNGRVIAWETGETVRVLHRRGVMRARDWEQLTWSGTSVPLPAACARIRELLGMPKKDANA